MQKQIMRVFTFFLILLAAAQGAIAQAPSSGDSQNQKVVVVTGARFSYALVQRWIDDFTSLHPEVQIIIESRGSHDPAKYDVLAEVYEQDEKLQTSREYVYTGRYAILPVANSSSAFAKTFEKKGLNKSLIQQLFFHDLLADKSKQEDIKVPFTVYTRLQKAGVPIVFSKHFGFEQKDISGKSIAGADEHLIKALLRDSTGISYLPIPLIYDIKTGYPIQGLAVPPIDIDGNGKVNDDERVYDNLPKLLDALESEKSLKSIPVDYLHLSVDRKSASPEAVAFLKWVNENGAKYLHEFGYLLPGKEVPNGKFTEFASKRNP